MTEEENNLKVLPSCSQACYKKNKTCETSSCRYWVDYKKELNCSLISAHFAGPMTLREVSERLGISLVRVSQLEKQAIKKLFKRIKM